MKTKFTLLVSALAMLCAFSSCKKTTNDEPAADPTGVAYVSLQSQFVCYTISQTSLNMTPSATGTYVVNSKLKGDLFTTDGTNLSKTIVVSYGKKEFPVSDVITIKSTVDPTKATKGKWSYAIGFNLTTASTFLNNDTSTDVSLDKNLEYGVVDEDVLLAAATTMEVFKVEIDANGKATVTNVPFKFVQDN